MNLTAEKVRDGVMSLKNISTRNLVLYGQALTERELLDMIGAELEFRHNPRTGLQLETNEKKNG